MGEVPWPCFTEIHHCRWTQWTISCFPDVRPVSCGHPGKSLVVSGAWKEKEEEERRERRLCNAARKGTSQPR